MAKASTQSKTIHVYSTLANDQLFTTYVPGGADLQVQDRQVLVRGGTGIATKTLVTPRGVYTALSEEEYEAIKDLHHFKHFVANGLISVETRKASDTEKVYSNMNANDPSGANSPESFAGEGKPEVLSDLLK